MITKFPLSRPKSDETQAQPLQRATLEQLIAKMESLGRISIEKSIFGGEYRAQIHIHTNSGFHAIKGEDQTFYFACEKALRNALELLEKMP